MNNSFWIPKHTFHDLTSWQLCLEFLGPQKSYCTTQRNFHMTGYLSHTVQWTCEEFLLVLLSLSLGIWGYISVLQWEWQGLTPSYTSSNAQKQSTWPPARPWVQCCHQLSIKEFYFSDAHILWENKFRLTLTHPCMFKWNLLQSPYR
jgi:hypothetical protein